MSKRHQIAAAWLVRFAWLPVPAFFIAIIVLWMSDLRTSYHLPVLLLTMNGVFSGLVSLCIGYLAGRGFLNTGRTGPFMLGCGATVWGVACVVSSIPFLQDANTAVTIHNVGALGCAACHLAGLLWGGRVKRPAWWLAAGYTGVLAGVGLLVYAASAGWTPAFFVDGVGGTAFRQQVLVLTIAMLGLTAYRMLRIHRRQSSAFLYWYALGLIMLALGLAGVMMQSVFGSLLGWTGRAAQFLAGGYMVIAAVSAVRQSPIWMITLSSALRDARRRYADLLDLADDGIVVHDMVGRTLDGRFLQVNPAFCRMIGYTSRELRELTLLDLTAPEELPAGPNEIETLWSRGALRHEKTLVAKYGRRIPTEIATRLFKQADRQMAMSIVRDTSERKQAELQIRRSAADLQAANAALRESRSSAVNLMEDALEARRQTERVNADLQREVAERGQAEAALRQSEEHLRQVNESLEQRVRERTAELALKNVQLKSRAEQLSRLASELTLTEQRERHRLAKVLHDHLQQLLVAAKIGLQGAAHSAVDPEQSEALGGVHNLIKESIATSRSLTVELSPTILHEAGLPAGLEWLARWMEKKHGLRVDLQCQSEARTEREDIRILLFESVRELLFNVVKHAGVTSAKVRMARRNTSLEIMVSDEGVGFDPQRLHAAAGEMAGGFGLFSIRERLELLGGSVKIESSPHGGSRFTLIAPAVFSAEAVEPQLEEAQPARPAEAARTADGGTKLRILVVDDHSMLRQTMAVRLRREPDIEIAGEAANGVEAIEKARQVRPDVILMDCNMPRMDGVEATRRIHAELPRIRIVGLSMHEDGDRAKAMLDTGASGYVNKTASLEELLKAIRSGA
ncbi:MAG: response regulator [Phycisphaerae bacterium]|nr:response regulator [Phycisphaerae bacterium]